MLTLVFGAPGTGKTTYLFKRILEDLAEGIPSFLIVPEQQAYISELTLPPLLPENAGLYLDIVSFSNMFFFRSKCWSSVICIKCYFHITFKSSKNIFCFCV